MLLIKNRFRLALSNRLKFFDCKPAYRFIRIFISLIVVLLYSNTASSQFLDSIRLSLKKNPKFLFKFDTRNSFIANQSARIFGWNVGVEFGKTLRIGGGFHTLIKHGSALDKIIDGDTAILKFNYFAYFIDYVFYKRKKWEFSIPLQIGIGSSRYEFTDQNSSLIKLERKIVVLYEPAITGHYKITKWFGVGMGAGFRIMIVNNKALDKKFNSPIYILNVKIFLGDIYKAIIPPRLSPNRKES